MRRGIRLEVLSTELMFGWRMVLGERERKERKRKKGPGPSKLGVNKPGPYKCGTKKEKSSFLASLGMT
jgi:hypothetical protein